jgi:hemerythrin-like domain-containing protein
MKNQVLARLHEDHARFDQFFAAIEDQCSRLETGLPADMPRLKAIIEYLGRQEFPRHQALEEAIFAKLLARRPHFREDIFDLTEDHKVSQRQFTRLVRAVESGNETLMGAARSFVANERGHFISEEETLFHAAGQYLSENDWHQLSEGVKAEGNRPAPMGERELAAELRISEPPRRS